MSHVSHVSEQGCVRRSIDEPEGVLSLTLVQAAQLVNKDSRLLGQGVSDPYATLDFVADTVLYRFKSFTIKDNLNPVWNFLCQVPVEDSKTVSDIAIKLYDKDEFSKDDPLGEVAIPRSVIKRARESGAEQDFWLMLTNTETGSVRSRVSWSSLSPRPPVHNDDQALVIVHLHSCANIFAKRESKPDVVVSVTINKKTKVSSKTVANPDPIFEDRMLILSDNPTVDDVKIDVIDMKNDKLAGSVSIELTQLLNRADLCLFDETFQLTNKGALTSGSVRMTLALRYLHPTSPLPGPTSEVEEKQTEEENIFDIGLRENDQSDNVEFNKKEQNMKVENDNSSKQSKTNSSSARENGKNMGTVAPTVPPPPPPQKKLVSNGNRIIKSNSVNFNSLTKSAPNGKTKSLPKKDAGPRIHLSVKYNQTTSVVSLIVHKVANLGGVTHKKLPNPYVKTYILENLFSSNKRDVHSKKKTKTKKGTFNPVFEETLEYFVPQYELQYHKLEVESVVIFIEYSVI